MITKFAFDFEYKVEQIVIVNSQECGIKARKVRKEYGLTLSQIAKEMNYSPAYLSLLEKGKKRWSLDLLTKFSEAIENLKKAKK